MSSMKKGLRRVAAVAVAALVVAPALATGASATATFSFDRVDGANRYETSVETAVEYGDSTNVILANGDNRSFPDALTASYLAGLKNAPILLTKLAATPDNIAAQIAASGATDVWLVGGEGVISIDQEVALNVDYTVHRLGGLDRWLTAEKVIAEGGDARSNTAILATGLNFPDAIAGGPLSYVKGMPLAITRANALPAETLRALKVAAVTNVIVLGGPTIITQNVLDQLAANGITLNRRIYGLQRDETASRLADYMITSQGFSNTAVNVASGYTRGGGADALGGGPLSGLENRPTLITRSDTVGGPGIEGFLTAHAPTLTTGHIFGGFGAVSEALQATMTAAARTGISNQDLIVTPVAAASLTVVGDDDPNVTTDDRTFTGTGLTDGTAYRVSLFAAADVTTDGNGMVSFADGTNDSKADGEGDTSVASITKTNNAAIAPAGTVLITPFNGSLNFTIDGSALGSVVPVLYIDTAVIGLDLNADDQPTELFGLGGVTTYNAPAAAAGATVTAGTSVVSVDKAANTFNADEATAGVNVQAFTYDANDLFAVDGGSVGIVAFEAALSTGDTIAVSAYGTDPAGVSNFALQDINPGTPATVMAEKGATLATTNDITVTVDNTPAVDFDTIVIQRAPVTGAGNTDEATTGTVGTYATIATPTLLDDAVAGDDFQYVDNNVAVGTYRYRAAFVKDGQQDDYTADVNNETSTTPVIDAIAPIVTSTMITINGGTPGVLDDGDTFTMDFSEAMAALAGATSFVRVTDGDSVYQITGVFTLGNGATLNDQVTVAVTTASLTFISGTANGIDYAGSTARVSLASADFKDGAGNGINLAGSTDVIIN